MTIAQCCGGANVQFRCAFDHNQSDRAIALQLQYQRAIEFQVRSQQHRRCNELTQQALHRYRITLVRKPGLPGLFKPDNLNACAVIR